MANTVAFPSIPLQTGFPYARAFPLPSAARAFPLDGIGLNSIIGLPYTISTLSVLIGRVREQLISAFWSDAELTLYIQDGLRIWNTLTLYYRNRVGLTFAATEPFYDLGYLVEDFMLAYRIEGGNYTIEPVSIESLGAYVPRYQNSIAAALQWIPMGLNLIALYPQTSAPLAASLDYVRLAPIPSNLMDYVQLGEEDISALIDFVVFLAHLKEGGSEVETATPRLQNFLKQAAKYNSRLLTSSVYRRMIGMASGGQPSERPTRSDRQVAR